MKRKNNELKMLANLAKQRLLHAEYVGQNSVETDKPKVTASSYFITNAKALRRLKAETEYVKLTDSIDSGFIKNVVSMLSLDKDIYNPLGVLSDNEYFRSLSEVEKQFYILNLSDKYTSIKSMYDTNQLDALKIS